MRKSPRRVPTQARARETVTAILDAVQLEIDRTGIDAVDVNDVARIAGVSIGSLYQYFGTKEALLAAWEERRIEAGMQAFMAFHLESQQRAPSLREGVREHAEFAYDSLARFLEPYSRLDAQPDDVASRLARRVSALDVGAGLIRNALERRAADGVAVEDIDVASVVTVTAFCHAIAYGLMLRPEAARNGTLKREIVDMVVRYVVGS